MMRARIIPKLLIISILCAFLVSAFRVSAYLRESGKYIEVCANGMVSVPKDVKFVKCYGIVRKVLRIEEVLATSMGDCQCPKCCDGECYIIVTLDQDPEDDSASCEDATYHNERTKKAADTNGGIYYLWLAC